MPKLSYDDVILEPQFSMVKHRSDVDLSVHLKNRAGKTFSLGNPLLSANMDSITEYKMAVEMSHLGGLGCLHRYASPEVIIDWVKELRSNSAYACVSIGVGSDDFVNAVNYIEAGAQFIIVDIAHGHSIMMKQMLEALNGLDSRSEFFLIAGNVATKAAAMDLSMWGADAIKCGIANGSVCDTKGTTGHGMPQFSTVQDCVDGVYSVNREKFHYETKTRKFLHPRPYLIADGGIKSSGDIVKALAAGADLVMIGGLLAGTNETPIVKDCYGNVTSHYRGMASSEAQLAHDGRIHNAAPEGISIEVHNRGAVKNNVERLLGGIRSGMSYSGALNYSQLRDNAKFHEVTSNFHKR